MGVWPGSAVLLVVAAATVLGQDYCRICQDHTMCLYQGVGRKCSPYLEGGVSEEGKNAILHAINSYRQTVAQGQETKGSPGPQPPAANMRMMVWSPSLARVAQRWAEQCDFTTDKCRADPQFRHVGQSIYRQSTTGSAEAQDWPAVVDKWYEHVSEFNRSFVSSYQWSGAGMYTQLVWAGTYQVGCGYAVYKESQEDEWIHQQYVCNYGPGGNIVRRAMYNKGTACSKCPTGTACTNRKYSSLCV